MKYRLLIVFFFFLSILSAGLQSKFTYILANEIFLNILQVGIIPIIVLIVASYIKSLTGEKLDLAPELILIWFAFDISVLIFPASFETVVWEPLKHNFTPLIGIMFLLELLLWTIMIKKKASIRKDNETTTGISPRQFLFTICSWFFILLPTSIHFLLILHK